MYNIAWIPEFRQPVIRSSTASIGIYLGVFGDAENDGNIFKNVGTALDLESAPIGCPTRANRFIITLHAFFDGYGGFEDAGDDGDIYKCGKTFFDLESAPWCPKKGKLVYNHITSVLSRVWGFLGMPKTIVTFINM